MKEVLLLTAICLLFAGCKSKGSSNRTASIIGYGRMPDVARDDQGNFHAIFGSGDSIMYSYSDNNGESFSAPTLIAVVPQLAASHTRGPQLAATSGGLVLTACNEPGNIVSFIKDKSNRWKQTGVVNDVDTVAKENLMALSTDGNNAFAVWLDLRDKHNKIFGARSGDGGQTWSKNILVYASPDTTVCECCKPTVVMQGSTVSVMFRNWLSGNRDMHLIQSADGGQSFGKAQKLGNGSWALNGCPMDGGGLALNEQGIAQTVWNRKGKIYASRPGEQEIELGEGRGCVIESQGGKTVYAWLIEGRITVTNNKGFVHDLGRGQRPVLKMISNSHVLCVWENEEKQIYSTILSI